MLSEKIQFKIWKLISSKLHKISQLLSKGNIFLTTSILNYQRLKRMRFSVDKQQYKKIKREKKWLNYIRK